MPRADAPLAGTVVPSVWSARSDAGGVPEHGRTRAKERGADQGWFGTIAGGVLGAVIGGVLYAPVTGDRVAFGWRIGRFVVAVVGAPVPIAGLRPIRGRA